MVAVTYRMPAGIPGATSRNEHLVSEPQYVDATNALTAPLAYGTVVKIVAGLVQAIASGDTMPAVPRFLIRAYPGSAVVNDPLGISTGPTTGLVSTMRRGYMTVLLATGEGTAAKDAPVYLRITANTSPTRAVGNISAGADSGKALLIPNCVFVGPADAAGNVEIAFNI